MSKPFAFLETCVDMSVSTSITGEGKELEFIQKS